MRLDHRPPPCATGRRGPTAGRQRRVRVVRDGRVGRSGRAEVIEIVDKHTTQWGYLGLGTARSPGRRRRNYWPMTNVQMTRTDAPAICTPTACSRTARTRCARSRWPAAASGPRRRSCQSARITRRASCSSGCRVRATTCAAPPTGWCSTLAATARPRPSRSRGCTARRAPLRPERRAVVVAHEAAPDGASYVTLLVDRDEAAEGLDDVDDFGMARSLARGRRDEADRS